MLSLTSPHDSRNLIFRIERALCLAASSMPQAPMVQRAAGVLQPDLELEFSKPLGSGHVAR